MDDDVFAPDDRSRSVSKSHFAALHMPRRILTYTEADNSSYSDLNQSAQFYAPPPQLSQAPMTFSYLQQHHSQENCKPQYGGLDSTSAASSTSTRVQDYASAPGIQHYVDDMGYAVTNDSYHVSPMTDNTYIGTSSLMRTPSHTNGIAPSIPSVSDHRSSHSTDPKRYIPLFKADDKHGNLILPGSDEVIVSHSTVGVLRIYGHDQDVRPNEVLVVIGEDVEPITYPSSAGGIPGIHILQERTTGKTLDVFVEVASPAVAMRILQDFDDRVKRRKDVKFGTRRARVEISTPSEMMKHIFPRAKCNWQSGMPVLHSDSGSYDYGVFGGFVTTEELKKCQTLALNPDAVKSHAARMCPERVYQVMMTTLIKIPWDAQPRHVWFDEDWLQELIATIEKMCIKLAHELRSQRYLRLDVKLLTQFMTVVRHCALFGRSLAGVTRYNLIAERVDSILTPIARKTPSQLAEHARLIGAVESPLTSKTISSGQRRKSAMPVNDGSPVGPRRDSIKSLSVLDGWKTVGAGGRVQEVKTKDRDVEKQGGVILSRVGGRFAALASVDSIEEVSDEED